MESHSIEAAQERAALFAAGAMSEGERQEFEAHLTAGCGLCQAEVDVLATVAARLGESAPVRRPRAALRQRVQDAVAAADDVVMENDGVRFVRSQFLTWENHGDGVPQTKRLSHDAERGYRTVLVRMRPGDKYPRHRHAGIEEVYLLEGDLLINGISMQPGDYCRAEAGSVHSEISSERGCTFFIVANDHDQILAAED